ncbi:aminodeoxychorismate synthase component I [Thiomicrorhabdus sp. zzn3]|uniref:aminodeoxychorismate synthase component I n=1 Tax=Thiomicrorhabdus sp. zzn3 TaxID=3039775 RepID=UPI00243710D4|nr:aminodeoxychorismate synthase component I [Thiomicrorhabdus sp. zzn3]MDG6778282.1 aminodeoxychorismate synthase component I [Thiomicrorhabdus sp. zzn3]
MERRISSDSEQAVIVQPVSLSDAYAVDLSLLHQRDPQRYPFLLESVAKGHLGRYDILFAFPQETLQLGSGADRDAMAAFTATAKQAFEAHTQPDIRCDLPFHGGWFAYFSYDYAQVVEPSLQVPPSRFPLATLTRVPAAVVRDHHNQAVFIVAEAEYRQQIAEIEADLQVISTQPIPHTPIQILEAQEEEEAKYLSGVEAIKEYILAGDVFQVNLSRQWQVSLASEYSNLDVYRALRRHNPAPFAALAHFDMAHADQEQVTTFGQNDFQQAWSIISSSPERLVKYQAPWVETRPIAGTRKRDADQTKDRALVEELISHPKERAEHIMLIDLERNDLGRICQPGTVEVNELMVVESYEHVHHIVSNVRGQLQPGLDPLDIVHALFPGGTITGCPKVRCMEIIAELEQMPREAYTGSLGYINRDGSLDLNILIRTMLHFQDEQNAPVVQFRAGAGIVADSDPQNELTETRHKAKGLIHALSSQERFR